MGTNAAGDSSTEDHPKLNLFSLRFSDAAVEAEYIIVHKTARASHFYCLPGAGNIHRHDDSGDIQTTRFDRSHLDGGPPLLHLCSALVFVARPVLVARSAAGLICVLRRAGLDDVQPVDQRTAWFVPDWRRIAARLHVNSQLSTNARRPATYGGYRHRRRCPGDYRRRHRPTVGHFGVLLRALEHPPVVLHTPLRYARDHSHVVLLPGCRQCVSLHRLGDSPARAAEVHLAQSRTVGSEAGT